MILLELGALAVGDEVIVSQHRGRSWDYIRARVTKVARVWVELEEIENASSRKRTWRMRLDTQREGGEGNYLSHFRTPAQHEWEKQRDDAQTFLGQQGLRPAFASPWRGADQVIRLAALIRADIEKNGVPS